MKLIRSMRLSGLWNWQMFCWSNFTTRADSRAPRNENRLSFHKICFFLATIPRYYTNAFSMVRSILRLNFVLVLSSTGSEGFVHLETLKYAMFDMTLIALRRRKILVLNFVREGLFYFGIYLSCPSFQFFCCLSFSFTANWHQNIYQLFICLIYKRYFVDRNKNLNEAYTCLIRNLFSIQFGK